MVERFNEALSHDGKSRLAVRKIHPEYMGVLPKKDAPILLGLSYDDAFINCAGLVVLNIAEDLSGKDNILAFDFNPGMPLDELAEKYGLTYEDAKRYIAYGVHDVWENLLPGLKESLLDNYTTGMVVNTRALLARGKGHYGMDCLDILGSVLLSEEQREESGADQDQLTEIVDLVDDLLGINDAEPEEIEEMMGQTATNKWEVKRGEIDEISVGRVVGAEDHVSDGTFFLSIVIKKIKGDIMNYSQYRLSLDNDKLRMDRYVSEITKKRENQIWLWGLIINTQGEDHEEDKELARQNMGVIEGDFELQKEKGFTFVGKKEARTIEQLLRTLQDA